MMMTAKQKETIKDWHSGSNPEEIRANHMKLNIMVDFEKKHIKGVVTWYITPDPDVEFAYFDTQGLKIVAVHYQDGYKAWFTQEEADPILGSTLKIQLKPDTRKLAIFYYTLENSTALQWLEPEQTFGKESPYIYTQGQSIYTRSWIPCPDSPGWRFTYEATVVVPQGLMALMSAENPQKKNKEGKYHFKMEQKIPAYLIALAVGDIEFQSIDERTGIYSEPAILEKSRFELEGTGKMIQLAESLYGAYRWDRYDVLVLPSGFPIGGMENPRLTFATPTILAGDKSLANLVAHELAHSWSGNLVTNATWNDFWLNEGFTVYFERRITEAQYDSDYAAMLWSLAKTELKKLIDKMGHDNPDTALYIQLKDRDPDDGFNIIPYEKGAAFLLKIEQTVGRERWDGFVKSYFDNHSFQSMDTHRFLKYLNENLLDEDEKWKNTIDAETWIFKPGIPENYPELKNPRFEKVEEQTTAYLEHSSASQLNTNDWSTYEWLHFLSLLPEKLSKEQMADLDEHFDFTHTGNSEIADIWFLISLRNQYTPAFEAMKDFLYVTGRQKFLEPLYSEMMKTAEGKEMAKEIYAIARPNYHPLTQKTIDKILNK